MLVFFTHLFRGFLPRASQRVKQRRGTHRAMGKNVLLAIRPTNFCQDTYHKKSLVWVGPSGQFLIESLAGIPPGLAHQHKFELLGKSSSRGIYSPGLALIELGVSTLVGKLRSQISSTQHSDVTILVWSIGFESLHMP